MKLYVTLLLHAISILAFAGSTLGDVESGCPLVHGNKARNVHDMLADSLDRCFGKVGGVDLQSLVDNSSPEVSPTFFREYCDRQELIKTCLSTSSYSSVCLNETDHSVLGFLEDILKTTLSYSCVDHGKHLSFVIFRAFVEDDATKTQNALTDCFAVAKSSLVESDNLDISTSVLGFYREFKVFKHCLMDRMRGMDRAVFGAELILNGILRRMKCLHPDNGMLTLCETIDTTPSTEEKVCPFDGINHDELLRFDSFFHFGTSCAEVNLDRLYFHNLTRLTTIEDYRSFFNTYCQNRPYMLDCLGDVSSNSKVCQNQTNHQVLGIFTDLISHSLETGCQQDGETFATIFSGMFNTEEKALGNNTMKECTQSSAIQFRSGSNISVTLTSKTLLVYRVVESLKQCILDGSSDVGAFKTVFASFMNDILGAAKCVNPVDGATVLCETLVTN